MAPTAHLHFDKIRAQVRHIEQRSNIVCDVLKLRDREW